LPGPSIRVAPDPRRVELTAPAVIEQLRRASDVGGHGAFLDYVFDIGGSVRGIVLDDVHHRSGAGAIVRPFQVTWLRRQLARAGRRWVIVFSHEALDGASGGEALLALLDRDPHVVATVAGNTHRNSIVARPTAAGGYWMITTASLVDFPQQVRAFRLARTRGGVVLQTWMLDTDPRSRLASISRELAFLDYQGGRVGHDAGTRGDRNVSLYLAR
jgi:hypothetical protein